VRWLLIGEWYVCVLYRGSNCSPSRAMDGRIMHHGIISSCQSAATSEIVKCCCSSLVSSAVTSTQTFYLYLYLKTSINECRHFLKSVVEWTLCKNSPLLGVWKFQQFLVGFVLCPGCMSLTFSSMSTCPLFPIICHNAWVGSSYCRTKTKLTSLDDFYIEELRPITKVHSLCKGGGGKL